MASQVKFCGLTRPADAVAAAELSARYLGVIFAGGPRLVTPEAARAVLDAAGDRVLRAGVFGPCGADDVARVAAETRLDVVQLHGRSDPASVAAVRRVFPGEVWAVLRVGPGGLPPDAEALFCTADAVVLDAMVAGRLGGTGVALDWERLRASVDSVRRGGRLVLAGGLRPGNVARAISLLEPDVVDVSSGVEQSPGVKDPARMRAFAAAVGIIPDGEP